MTWVVEIPKYKYGYGFVGDCERYYFETQEEAKAFQKKLHAWSQIYKEGTDDYKGALE